MEYQLPAMYAVSNLDCLALYFPLDQFDGVHFVYDAGFVQQQPLSYSSPFASCLNSKRWSHSIGYWTAKVRCSLHFDSAPYDLMDSNCFANSRGFFRYGLFGDDDFWLKY